MIPYKVCVVTVTYGSRWKFLHQVLLRVLSFSNVSQVVIVDNASADNIGDQIADDRVIVLSNTENEGSAGGYKRGIAYAFNYLNSDFIWLLDDDNLPDERALAELLEHWDNVEGSNIQKALFCFRPDREVHAKIAQGLDPYQFYLTPNNFLGFSITRIINNKYRKVKECFKKPGHIVDKAIMPYVPYGGLLMHRQMVEQIGYPNADFFLYVDDSEFSYRITQKGAKIYLLPSAIINDIDLSQGINYRQGMFRSQLLDLWNFRTYYHVRNRIYFYSRVAVTNKLLFAVNKILYLGWLWLLSILGRKSNTYSKLLIAVDDGLTGKLGKADQDKF